VNKLAYMFYFLAALYVISPIDFGLDELTGSWRTQYIPTALLIGLGWFCMQKHKKNNFKFNLQEGEEILWKHIGMGAACCITSQHIYCYYVMGESMKKDLLKRASKEAFYPTENSTKLRRSEIARIGSGKSKLREIMVLEMKDGSKFTPPIWGKSLQSFKGFLLGSN